VTLIICLAYAKKLWSTASASPRSCQKCLGLGLGLAGQCLGLGLGLVGRCLGLGLGLDKSVLVPSLI